MLGVGVYFGAIQSFIGVHLYFIGEPVATSIVIPFLIGRGPLFVYQRPPSYSQVIHDVKSSGSP